MMTADNIRETSILAHRVVELVGRSVFGKRELLKTIMVGILADGHLLFEDYPGLAKTLTVNLFARCLGLEFRRIQFTPDLLPADITGSFVFNQKSQEFELREGPLFETNVILADEINRAPPKTQSALLESMGEYQISLEGRTYKAAQPFIVMATQNPIELEGTFGLPEAQLDRFLMRISVGYPDENASKEMLFDRIRRKSKFHEIQALADPGKVLEMQGLVEEITVSESILDYIVRLVDATRDHPRIEIGASPRGCLALLQIARANALFEQRDYVVPDDVKIFGVSALSHRIILRSSEWMGGTRSTELIKSILSSVEAPRKDVPRHSAQ